MEEEDYQGAVILFLLIVFYVAVSCDFCTTLTTVLKKHTQVIKSVIFVCMCVLFFYSA